jgi:hypothetical protein
VDLSAPSIFHTYLGGWGRMAWPPPCQIG